MPLLRFNLIYNIFQFFFRIMKRRQLTNIICRKGRVLGWFIIKILSSIRFYNRFLITAILSIRLFMLGSLGNSILLLLLISVDVIFIWKNRSFYCCIVFIHHLHAWVLSNCWRRRVSSYWIKILFTFVSSIWQIQSLVSLAAISRGDSSFRFVYNV